LTPFHRALLVTVALAGVLGSAATSAGQVATAPDLKAAFLLNFARYTDWPAAVLPPGANLAICVSGDDRVADTLTDLARRQQVHDREVTVIRVGIDAPDGCHVLFWSGTQPAERQALLRSVAGKPVLTVGDASDFTRAGGTINFFVEAERMRFAVNPAAAKRAGLTISSRLLDLAVLVKEVTHGS
jgi:hypothetical protein